MKKIKTKIVNLINENIFLNLFTFDEFMTLTVAKECDSSGEHPLYKQ